MFTSHLGNQTLAIYYGLAGPDTLSIQLLGETEIVTRTILTDPRRTISLAKGNNPYKNGDLVVITLAGQTIVEIHKHITVSFESYHFWRGTITVTLFDGTILELKISFFNAIKRLFIPSKKMIVTIHREYDHFQLRSFKKQAGDK